MYFIEQYGSIQRLETFIKERKKRVTTPCVYKRMNKCPATYVYQDSGILVDEMQKGSGEGWLCPRVAEVLPNVL